MHKDLVGPKSDQILARISHRAVQRARGKVMIILHFTHGLES